MIPQEVIALGALGILEFVGGRLLKTAGQADLADYLRIIIVGAGSVLAIKMFWESIADSLAVVGVHL